MVHEAYFFNMVSVQPSIVISSVAAKKLIMPNDKTRALKFGFPTSGNHSSMLDARYNKNAPGQQSQRIL